MGGLGVVGQMRYERPSARRSFSEFEDPHTAHACCASTDSDGGLFRAFMHSKTYRIPIFEELRTDFTICRSERSMSIHGHDIMPPLG